jgi:hypothetical protein
LYKEVILKLFLLRNVTTQEAVLPTPFAVTHVQLNAELLVAGANLKDYNSLLLLNAC